MPCGNIGRFCDFCRIPGSSAEIGGLNKEPCDVHDAKARSALLQVPTALTILPGQVDKLQEAGRAALRSSAEFQRLRASLAGMGLGAAGQGSTDPARQRKRWLVPAVFPE